ncbi:MAG: phosphoribosylanthranilate isomerase [Anaerolineales bacterium]|nr:phosphoribosylanthranilate isomerase [Anaerolineales bacterium]
MRIKICGVKTLEDSLIACGARADMLGFNFYAPSPRYIEQTACRKIITEIKAVFSQVVCVGVFVNHSATQIETIMDFIGLDLAQLSGDEPPETLTALGKRAFKALRPQDPAELNELIAALPSRQNAPAFLLDSHHKGSFGGSGQTGDWELAARIAKSYPILLAGGLNPDNVAEAIRVVQPWGVDVASGVESQRGVKDSQRIVNFIQQARVAAQEIITP